MKHTSLMVRSLVAASAVLACVAAQAQETRIAAVNSDRIMRDSAPAKAAQVKLESEFARRDKELQDLAQRLKTAVEKLEKDGPVLAESDRVRRQRELSELDREFQRKQREFREDLNNRRNEELAQVLERANRVIRQLAEKRNYDLIVQEAVYVSPRIDITDEVLKVLNEGK